MARQGNFFSFLADEESEVDPAELAAKIEAERLKRLKEEEDRLKRLKEEEDRLKRLKEKEERLKDEKERQLNPQYQPLTAATSQPLPPSQYVKSKTVGGGGGSGGSSGKSFRNHGEMNGYQGNNGGAGGYRRNNGGADGYQHNYKGNGGAEGSRRNNGWDGQGQGLGRGGGRGRGRGRGTQYVEANHQQLENQQQEGGASERNTGMPELNNTSANGGLAINGSDERNVVPTTEGLKDAEDELGNADPAEARRKEEEEEEKEYRKKKAEERREERREEEKKMTLMQYEKSLLEKKKDLETFLNKGEKKVTVERKVTVDDFESMQLVGKKREDSIQLKFEKEKLKKKDSLDKEERARKVKSVILPLGEMMPRRAGGRGRGYEAQPGRRGGSSPRPAPVADSTNGDGPARGQEERPGRRGGFSRPAPVAGSTNGDGPGRGQKERNGSRGGFSRQTLVADSTNGDGRGRGQKERTGRGYSQPPVADSTTGAGVGGNRGAENSQPQVAVALPSVDDPLHFPDLGKEAVKA